MVQIIRKWWKWRKDWDALCCRCGKCCYIRRVGKSGEVIIDYSQPCEFLDEETHLCTVYEERFTRCAHCRKVNLWIVLFNPTLPEDCMYRMFFWRH